MKRPSCRDCLHCKVRTGQPMEAREPVAYCDKDSWPAMGHTELVSLFHGPNGMAMAARFAEGCLHFEDMAG